MDATVVEDSKNERQESGRFFGSVTLSLSASISVCGYQTMRLVGDIDYVT